MTEIFVSIQSGCSIPSTGFLKFAGHAGHVQRILKMSGEELLDRRTKCPARKKMNRCSLVILSLKMSGESLKCPAKNLRFTGQFVRRVTKSFREACIYIIESVGTLLSLHLAAGIRTPPQSNMPIKGNALKTSFQHYRITADLFSWF